MAVAGRPCLLAVALAAAWISAAAAESSPQQVRGDLLARDLRRLVGSDFGVVARVHA